MSASSPRIGYEAYGTIAPAVRAALTALGKAVDDSGLDKALTELLKLRASQINGCAFCIQYHLHLARKAGVPAVKLDLVAAWAEAGIYSPRETAALAWTEALTVNPGLGATDALYASVREQFSETELAFLTAAIANINAWNRIAASLRFAVSAA
ncbi:MAG: carboxymuconolactone decarboxylase family protein [Rhizobiales bacterium]|nr:carboxymuconolactone decarboxylase family protein [Hyphomicrobiales bacterium]